jgi:hypothetical protein
VDVSFGVRTAGSLESLFQHMSILVNWHRLKPYKEDKRKSFEELCFQIAYSKHALEGTFVSVDDSGGGSGVEFYMTRKDGKEWGWQAKFYSSGRWNSSRRAAVKDSLKATLKTHPGMTHWFLCAPLDLTTKGSNSENKWFYTELKKLAPKVELVYWGDSVLLAELATRPGLRNFFFGDLDLSQQQCAKQVNTQLEAVAGKYIPDLHTPDWIDAHLEEVLGEKTTRLRSAVVRLEKGINELRKAISELPQIGSKWPEDSRSSMAFAEGVLKVFEQSLVAPKQILEFHARGDLRNAQEVRVEEPPVSDAFFKSVNISTIWDAFYNSTLDRNSAEYYTLRTEFEIAHAPNVIADTYWGTMAEFKQCSSLLRRSVVHVLGAAGFGKTHLACSITSRRIQKDFPALLLRGVRFDRHHTIREAILDYLDVPSSYSWTDLLEALEVLGSVSKTRIPIVIDGLNEAESLQRWKHEMPDIEASLRAFPNLVLITTCRSSYFDAIWGEGDKHDGRFIGLQSRTGQTLEQITSKYFAHYKLVVQKSFARLEHLENPLYLRLFCEAHRSETGAPTAVHLSNTSTAETLRRYINRVTTHVASKTNRGLSPNLILRRVEDFAREVWQTEERGVDLSRAIEIIDGVSNLAPTFRWDVSITKAVLDEDLLIYRERVGSSSEVVRFTYDRLGGLLIADALFSGLGERQARYLIASGLGLWTAPEDRFSSSNAAHPLIEDIINSVCLMAPKRFGWNVWEKTPVNSAIWSIAVNAIFELASDDLTNRDQKLIAHLIKVRSNHEVLFPRLLEVSTLPNNRLNAKFLDRNLQNFEMAERDLSWSECIRKNRRTVLSFLKEIRQALKQFDAPSKTTIESIRLSALVCKWLLTSNDEVIRDRATQALVLIGRRLPVSACDAAIDSLKVNDPYVSERMLSVAYSAAMTWHAVRKAVRFREVVLPRTALAIYRLMFTEGAVFSTTHAVTREYARGILELAIRHHPSLLHYAAKSPDGRIRYSRPAVPFGQYEFPPRPNEHVNSQILGMDWANYTLGRLVPSRKNYDFKSEGYLSVKRKILWRVHQLGYDPKAFFEIDQQIGRQHWQDREEQGKVDRYGKKYCWIGFFELYGRMFDDGLLRGRWHDAERRPSDGDIDPCFPFTRKKKFFTDSIVRESLDNDSRWLKLSSPSFPLEKVREAASQGMLLVDGFFSEFNKRLGRTSFFRISTFVVREADKNKLQKAYNDEKPTSGWLPDTQSKYSIFAGEIPWSADLGEDESIPILFRKRTPGMKNPIDVWNPVSRFELSTRTSIPRNAPVLPSHTLLKATGARWHPPYWEFKDAKGRIACTYEAFSKGMDSQHTTFFDRQSLASILKSRGLGMIWILWGERQLLTASGNNKAYKYFKAVLDLDDYLLVKHEKLFKYPKP